MPAMYQWSLLPLAARLGVLEILRGSDENDSKSGLAQYASVCKEWQGHFEKKLYRRLILTPSSLGEFDKLVRRQRNLVEHIWFRIELERDPCPDCKSCSSPGEMMLRDRNLATEAIRKLFFILCLWPEQQNHARHQRLTLDLSVWSPSDPQPDFKGDLHFGMNLVANEDAEGSENPGHDLCHGRRLEVPDRGAISRMFSFAVLEFPNGLPFVRVIRRLIIRRQTRRSFYDQGLAQILTSLPNLEHFDYEPWDGFIFPVRYGQDRGYERIISSSLPRVLRTLTLFEDFNEDYNSTYSFIDMGDVPPAWRPELIRTPWTRVSAALAVRSIRLERLFASNMLDAKDFFKACKPNWVRRSLTSLALTSRLLNRLADPSKVNDMLVAAGRTALQMPELQTLEIWNGMKGNACVFRYEATSTANIATISWCGTWDLQLSEELVRTWTQVALQVRKQLLSVQVNQKLDPSHITSHAVAIRDLKLSEGVIHPVSLEQILRE
ncbi:hypothetical protein BGZ63DRAFT_446536 [Mariannaea sp. PMI_226]|nr:hypothetical protein BGZ63DRAFT_446536 [Mariannaea sp. PMI_226]